MNKTTHASAVFTCCFPRHHLPPPSSGFDTPQSPRTQCPPSVMSSLEKGEIEKGRSGFRVDRLSDLPGYETCGVVSAFPSALLCHTHTHHRTPPPTRVLQHLLSVSQIRGAIIHPYSVPAVCSGLVESRWSACSNPEWRVGSPQLRELKSCIFSPYYRNCKDTL